MYMRDLLLLIVIASIVALSILTTNSVVAVSTGKRGGASVIQEQVNSSNPILNKAINKFYSCISKTHKDPPTIQMVDNCYSQNSIAGISGPASINHPHNNNNNIKTPSTSNSRIVTQPPGVLVEVP